MTGCAESCGALAIGRVPSGNLFQTLSDWLPRAVNGLSVNFNAISTPAADFGEIAGTTAAHSGRRTAVLATASGLRSKSREHLPKDSSRTAALAATPQAFRPTLGSSWSQPQIPALACGLQCFPKASHRAKYLPPPPLLASLPRSTQARLDFARAGIETSRQATFHAPVPNILQPHSIGCGPWLPPARLQKACRRQP